MEASTSKEKILLKDVNIHLTCAICQGYYVDATTMIECLHSFCRSCIIKHLMRIGNCPVCYTRVNVSKPHRYLKPDETLQNIVYKLVPGLYHDEMKRRRDFYAEHPEYVAGTTPEGRGVPVDGMMFELSDSGSISPEY